LFGSKKKIPSRNPLYFRDLSLFRRFINKINLSFIRFIYKFLIRLRMIRIISKESFLILETYEKRLLDLEKAVRKLQSDNISLNMDIDDMRNKVLRKIQFKKDKDNDDLSKEEGSFQGIPAV